MHTTNSEPHRGTSGVIDGDAADRSPATFREPVVRRGQRLVMATAFLLLPKRIRELPAFALAMAHSLLRGGVAHPTESTTYARPPGFGGIVRGATPESLVAAHRRGFFPQAHMGPLQWWTREERYVRMLSERQIPKTLRNEMRKARLTLTFDQAFDQVIRACAEPRPGRPKLTWITPRIMALYARMHAAGDAHSFELWDESGQLVGGGYGVAIGRIFVTESMFSRTSSASKMALQALDHHLAAWGFVLNDLKDFAPHFSGIGARHIARAEYAALLAEHAHAALPDASGPAWVATYTIADVVAAMSPAPTRKQPKAPPPDRDQSARAPQAMKPGLRNAASVLP